MGIQGAYKQLTISNTSMYPVHVLLSFVYLPCFFFFFFSVKVVFFLSHIMKLASDDARDKLVEISVFAYYMINSCSLICSQTFFIQNNQHFSYCIVSVHKLETYKCCLISREKLKKRVLPANLLCQCLEWFLVACLSQSLSFH